MKKTILALAVMAACGAANATYCSDGSLISSHPNNDCSKSTTTTPTATATATATGNGGNGGQGGAGGAGGNATGGNATGGNATGGNATGGSASAGNVGNVGSFSTVKNLSPEASASSTNVNTALGGNATQGQQQGQMQGQGQSQSVKNSGNSTNVIGVSTKGTVGNVSGGSVKNSGNSSNANNSSATTGPVTVTITQPDTSGATRDAADAAVQAALITGASSEEVARIQAAALRDAANAKIRNTPSVNGPQLTSSNDTCMGSTSGSANAPGIGIGFGTSWVDNNCRMLKNSRELWNMGFKAAAVALMCSDADNRAALEVTGFECPQTTKSKEATKKVADTTTTEYTDPIVRARLGLPAIETK